MAIKYAPIITGNAPIAKKRYFDDLARQLEEQSLSQSAQQFNQSLGLQKKAAKDADQQAAVGNALSGVGLATQAYPYAESAYQGLYNMIAPDSAATSAFSSEGPVSGMSPEVAAEYGMGAEGTAAYRPVTGLTYADAAPAAGSAVSGMSPELAAEYGMGAEAAAAEGAGTAGSTLGGIAGGVSIAAPYYALAKLGGKIGTDYVFPDDKPGFTGRGYGRAVSESLHQPLNVEQYWLDLAGAPEWTQTVADVLNPLAPLERGLGGLFGGDDSPGNLERFNALTPEQRKAAIEYVRANPPSPDDTLFSGKYSSYKGAPYGSNLAARLWSVLGREAVEPQPTEGPQDRSFRSSAANNDWLKDLNLDIFTQGS